MTERFTPAPGDGVWVKLIGCGSCPWWPGKVVNPQTCPQRYQGKKKLVAAVFFLSDNTLSTLGPFHLVCIPGKVIYTTRSLVTDEKNILPFDCKEKESFLETGKELRYRSQKLRLAFDYDVCCISGKTDNPAPQRNLSLNATPESSTMHLRRNRHRTEPMMRKLSSPSCSSYPWKNNRQKTTEPCSSVSTDAQPLQAPMNGETLIAEETPLKCCAIPQLDSMVDPLTNNLHITDGVCLKTSSIHTLPLSSVFQESNRQQGSGDSLLRQTSHAPQSFSTPMPVCIVYPEDSRGGNSNSCPSGTPPMSVLSVFRGGQRWTGSAVGIPPETSFQPARVWPSSPTVDELCHVEMDTPADLPGQWTPLIGDHTYTVERSTKRTEKPDANSEQCTCSGLQQRPLVGKHPFVKKHKQCANRWASVSKKRAFHSPKRWAYHSKKRWTYHSPKRWSKKKKWASAVKRNKWFHAGNKWTTVKQTRATSTCTNGTNSKLPSIPIQLISATNDRSSVKWTSTIAERKSSSEQLTLVADGKSSLNQSVSTKSYSNQPAPTTTERCISDQLTSDATRRSSGVLALATTERSSDQLTTVETRISTYVLASATTERSSSDQLTTVATRRSSGVLALATTERSSDQLTTVETRISTYVLAPATTERSSDQLTTVLTRRSSGVLAPAKTDRSSSDQLTTVATRRSSDVLASAKTEISSSDQLTTVATRRSSSVLVPATTERSSDQLPTVATRRSSGILAPAKTERSSSDQLTTNASRRSSCVQAPANTERSSSRTRTRSSSVQLSTVASRRSSGVLAPAKTERSSSDQLTTDATRISSCVLAPAKTERSSSRTRSSSVQLTTVATRRSSGVLAPATVERSSSHWLTTVANSRSSGLPVPGTTGQFSSNLLAPATNAMSSTDQSRKQSCLAQSAKRAYSKRSQTIAIRSVVPVATKRACSRQSTTIANRRSSLCHLVPATNELSSSEQSTLATNRSLLAQPARNKRSSISSEMIPIKKARSLGKQSCGSTPEIMEKTQEKQVKLLAEEIVAAAPSPSVSPSGGDMDDDDDLPQMTLDSRVQGPIGVGDLVWLKTRQCPFWPAIVKHVYKQKGRVHKVTCCFISECSKSVDRGRPYTTGCHKKKVVPFSADPLQHSRLKELGMQSNYASEFCTAVKKAEDFICQWAVEKTVTSLEFFADDIGSTWTRQSCLNGSTASPDEEMPLEDCSPPSVCESHMSSGSDNDSEASKQSCMSDAQRKRIERRRESGQKLINIVKSSQTKQYLQTIWTGELACPRRDLFMQKAKLSRRQKLEIKMQGYGGPIGDDDQMDELVLTVADFYRSCNPDFNMSYVIDVLVPEVPLECLDIFIQMCITKFKNEKDDAIIYALQKVRRVNKLEAEKIFQKGIRWTKEETAAVGQDMIRNADNIAPEDRIMYREKVDLLARKLSFAV